MEKNRQEADKNVKLVEKEIVELSGNSWTDWFEVIVLYYFFS